MNQDELRKMCSDLTLAKNRGEIVKEYLNTFTANELANLLLTRNSSN